MTKIAHDLQSEFSTRTYIQQWTQKRIVIVKVKSINSRIGLQAEFSML